LLTKLLSFQQCNFIAKKVIY